MSFSSLSRFRKSDREKERIDLDCNFRSRREVLSSVNDVFFRLMRREIGGIEYTDEVSLKCGTYARSGLLMDQDVFFTYSTDDVNLDFRYLSAKLNAVVYGTMLNFNQ